MKDEELDLILLNLRESLKNNSYDEAVKMIGSLHPVDLADLVSELSTSDQVTVLTQLEPSDSADVLEVMDDEDAAEVADQMSPKQLANILDEMETDEAADVISDINPTLAEKALRKMDDPSAIINLLQYPDDTAGGLMTTAVTTVRPHWTVMHAIDEIRKQSETSESTYYLFVLDEVMSLIGVVGLKDIVTSPRTTKISEIMERNVITVNVNEDQEECARIISRYNFTAIPVIDDFGRFLGIISGDDLFEVAEDEATEDMYRMVGLSSEERIDGSIRLSVARRLPWLTFNILTIFLAISIIDIFEPIIATMVVLAVFLPVVAGEGGIAGSQTMTIVVRALALDDINNRDGRRALFREMLIAFLNGLVIGIVTAIAIYFWKHNLIICWAIILAMVLNFVIAAIAGVIIPLGLKKLSIDPALASSVFVTTFTDTFGYFLFLGIISLMV